MLDFLFPPKELPEVDVEEYVLRFAALAKEPMKKGDIGEVKRLYKHSRADLLRWTKGDFLLQEEAKQKMEFALRELLIRTDPNRKRFFNADRRAAWRPNRERNGD